MANKLTIFKIISAAFVISMFTLATGFITLESGPITEHTLYKLTLIEVGSNEAVCYWGVVAVAVLFIFIAGYIFKHKLITQIGALMCLVVWTYAFGLLIANAYYIEALAFPLLHVVYWSIAYYKARTALELTRSVR